MRYTLAAFAIMASASMASPVALDSKTDEIAVRDTATTDAMNWGPYGGPPVSTYNQWTVDSWPDYDTWKRWASSICPWQGYPTFDDWWKDNGYTWWREVTGDDSTQYDTSHFDTWFEQEGYKTFDPRKAYNLDWFQDANGKGYHRMNGMWVEDDDGFSSWGTSDVTLDDDDDDWFQDPSGQGWHKVKSKDVWVKDDPSYPTPTKKKHKDPGYKSTPTPSSYSSSEWTKGSNGKWSKGY